MSSQGTTRRQTLGSHHAPASGSAASSGSIPRERTSRTRSVILSELRIGLRTFYRELELLKKCAVKVRHKHKLYHLVPTAARPWAACRFPTRN